MLSFAANQSVVSDDEWRDLVGRALEYLEEPANP